MNNQGNCMEEVNFIQSKLNQFKYFINRLKYKIPRLVWMDDEIDINIQFLNIPLGSHPEAFQSLWKAEAALSEVGISYDKGAGCGGRDWEWDWSLKGPVKVTFRGRKDTKRINRNPQFDNSKLSEIEQELISSFQETLVKC